MNHLYTFNQSNHYPFTVNRPSAVCVLLVNHRRATGTAYQFVCRRLHHRAGTTYHISHRRNETIVVDNHSYADVLRRYCNACVVNRIVLIRNGRNNAVIRPFSLSTSPACTFHRLFAGVATVSSSSYADVLSSMMTRRTELHALKAHDADLSISVIEGSMSIETLFLYIPYTLINCYIVYSNLLLTKGSVFIMSLPIYAREESIQQCIRRLLTVLPYPLNWYEKLDDKRISAIYRNNKQKVIDMAIARDEKQVRDRLDGVQSSIPLDVMPAPQKRVMGHYDLVCVNRCSLRFKFTTANKKVIHGVISTYSLKGFDMKMGEPLQVGNVCIAWETGRKEVMPVSLLISKIVDTALNGSGRALTRAIYLLQPGKKFRQQSMKGLAQ